MTADVPASTLAEPALGVPDYVFTFSYESYSDASRRGMMRPPDRLLLTLMASPAVGRLLVANPYRSWTTAPVRRYLDRAHRFPATPTRELVQPWRTARADPSSLPELEQTYRAYDEVLRRRGEELELVQPRVITANPLVAGFSPFEWAGPRLYYARDDWSSSPAREAFWPAYREAYRRLGDQGVAVAAVSEVILDRIAPRGPHAVVANGIEPQEWLGPLPEAPAWFGAIPGPRALYVGTLDSRLDVPGIRQLAQQRPDLQIVLLGPLPDPGYVADLRGLANVHVHGQVGRAELTATMRHAELTLLAHRRTPLTEAMSPLKVYESLAAGAPVLATDLAPVRGLGPHVHLAPEVGDFDSLVDGVLNAGRVGEAERLAFIESNTWASRHAQILELLE